MRDPGSRSGRAGTWLKRYAVPTVATTATVVNLHYGQSPELAVNALTGYSLGLVSSFAATALSKRYKSSSTNERAGQRTRMANVASAIGASAYVLAAEVIKVPSVTRNWRDAAMLLTCALPGVLTGTYYGEVGLVDQVTPDTFEELAAQWAAAPNSAGKNAPTRPADQRPGNDFGQFHY